MDGWYSHTCILGLDSYSAGSLSPGPAVAVGLPLLPPLAGRRCGSFSPRGSDAQPSTSPAGSSGYGLQQHPPMGIMILKTTAGQLAEKYTVYGPAHSIKEKKKNLGN